MEIKKSQFDRIPGSDGIRWDPIGSDGIRSWRQHVFEVARFATVSSSEIPTMAFSAQKICNRAIKHSYSSARLSSPSDVIGSHRIPPDPIGSRRIPSDPALYGNKKFEIIGSHRIPAEIKISEIPGSDGIRWKSAKYRVISATPGGYSHGY